MPKDGNDNLRKQEKIFLEDLPHPRFLTCSFLVGLWANVEARA